MRGDRTVGDSCSGNSYPLKVVAKYKMEWYTYYGCATFFNGMIIF